MDAPIQFRHFTLGDIIAGSPPLVRSAHPRLFRLLDATRERLAFNFDGRVQLRDGRHPGIRGPCYTEYGGRHLIFLDTEWMSSCGDGALLFSLGHELGHAVITEGMSRDAAGGEQEPAPDRYGLAAKMDEAPESLVLFVRYLLMECVADMGGAIAAGTVEPGLQSSPNMDFACFDNWSLGDLCGYGAHFRAFYMELFGHTSEFHEAAGIPLLMENRGDNLDGWTDKALELMPVPLFGHDFRRDCALRALLIGSLSEAAGGRTCDMESLGGFANSGNFLFAGPWFGPAGRRHAFFGPGDACSLLKGWRHPLVAETLFLLSEACIAAGLGERKMKSAVTRAAMSCGFGRGEIHDFLADPQAH